MQHAVVGTESGKILAGHDGKLSPEQAKARAEKANTDAEALGISTRYEAVEVENVKTLP